MPAPGRVEASLFVFWGWFCERRYELMARWASPEGAHAGGTFCGKAAGTTVPAGPPGARQCRWIGCGAGLGDQAESAGPGDGLGAVSRAELGEDVADVLFDGVEGDHEAVGDALI